MATNQKFTKAAKVVIKGNLGFWFKASLEYPSPRFFQFGQLNNYNQKEHQEFVARFNPVYRKYSKDGGCIEAVVLLFSNSPEAENMVTEFWRKYTGSVTVENLNPESYPYIDPEKERED